MKILLSALRALFLPLVLAGSALASEDAPRADLALSWPEMKRPALFASGQRIACIGDSITRPGQYIIYLYDYYATRFPDRPIRLFNFGIGGDTMADALIRYENDIRAVPCDSAVILLGMNDAFRSGYGPGSGENPATLSRRKSTCDTFDQRLETLLARLAADRIAPILCTPTYYDETTVSKYALTPGGNLALLALAEVIKSRAQSGGYPIIELNRPLVEANAALQTSSPSTSIIGGDRVHPLVSGQAVMAWAFLREQGAPAEVATVEIDARAKSLLASRNCEVTELAVSPNDISFRYRPFALPLPRDKGWEAAAACTRLTRDLNQERFTVLNLPEGRWTLTIGEMDAGIFTAKELGEGINLATLANTPQLKAADDLHALNLKRNQIETSIRGIHYLEKVMKIPGGAPEAVWREKIAAYIASPEYQKLAPDAFYKTEADHYIEKKTREKELYQQLEEATQAMYAAFPRTAWPVRLTRSESQSAR